MFGYLSSAYNWTYASLQLPSGLLLDRFGVRRVGIVSTAIWSVASFATAICTGVGGLFGARFLLGIGEAPTFPANAKAIGYWFPKDERSLATAMFDSAAKFSSAIGIPLLGLLLFYFGWRWNFAATGFVSVLYFGLFYAFYRNPSEDKLLTDAEREFIAQGGAQPEDRARAAKGAPLGYLLQQRKVCGLALGFASYNYTFYLLLTWLPSYLSTALHVDLLHSALYTSVPWVFATFTDLVVGGWLVDALIHRRGARSHCSHRPILDQHFHWGIVCRFARRMVDSVADCSTRKRRHGRRHSEFLQSARGNCRAHCDWVCRTSNAFLFWSVHRRHGFSAGWDRGIYFPARADRANPGTGVN